MKREERVQIIERRTKKKRPYNMSLVLSLGETASASERESGLNTVRPKN